MSWEQWLGVVWFNTAFTNPLTLYSKSLNPSSYFKRSVLFFFCPSVLLITRSFFSVATVLFLWQPVSPSVSIRLLDEAFLQFRVFKLICKVSSRPFVLPFVCGCYYRSGRVTCGVSSALGHEIHFQEYVEAHCSLSLSHSTWACSSAFRLSLWCFAFLPYCLSIDFLVLWMSVVEFFCEWQTSLFVTTLLALCFCVMQGIWFVQVFRKGEEPGCWWMTEDSVFLHSLRVHLKCKMYIH